MYNPIRSHQGSALIVWLVIVVLLTILTTSFLEKILWLGRTTSAITNSAQSYTLTTGIIEEQLMDPGMTRQAPWNILSRSEGNSSSTGRTLIASTGWYILPEPLKWNSSFDPNWNTISLWDPVQIVIPNNLDWNNVVFYFRVPAIPGVTNTGSANTNSGMILWTFGYSGASLYASGETEIFRWGDIGTTLGKQIAGFTGGTNTGSVLRFDNFYNDSINGVWSNGAKCSGFQCTLKLSMIRPFLTNWGQSFSFLEYKIDFTNVTPSVRIPSQYMTIDSSASVYGYIRSRQIRIPQITSSTTTDFAVLQ